MSTPHRHFTTEYMGAPCEECDHEAWYHEEEGPCGFVTEGQAGPFEERACNCNQLRVSENIARVGPLCFESHEPPDATERPWKPGAN